MMAGAKVFWIPTIGPLAMLALFSFVSIELMESRQLQRRASGYSQYIRDVPNSFLPIPSRVNRLIHDSEGFKIRFKIKSVMHRIRSGFRVEETTK